MATNGQGSNTKLTPDVHAKLVEVFAAGGTKVTAADLVGVDLRTVNNWLRWGEHGLQEGKSNVYVDLFLAVRRAHAERELTLLGTAQAGDAPGFSNGPAKSAQWALERTFGSKYAARQVVKVEDALETLLDAVERICKGKDCGCLEAIWAAIAREDGSGEAADASAESSQPIH
jgi:hypothetical protein